MKKFILLSVGLFLTACTATLDDADTNGDGIVTPKEQEQAGIHIDINNNNTIIILDDRKALDNLTLFNTNNSNSDSTAAATATAVDNKTDNSTSDNSSS